MPDREGPRFQGLEQRRIAAGSWLIEGYQVRRITRCLGHPGGIGWTVHEGRHGGRFIGLYQTLTQARERIADIIEMNRTEGN